MGVLLMAIMSLTSTGLKDFFVQRVTAIIIAVYFAYLLIEALCLSHSGQLNYEAWYGLFTGSMFFRIATLMAYLAVFFHAWVGIWIICGDYIKCAWASATVMLTFVLSYIFCFFWLFAVLFFY
ncbi:MULTISPECIES: succinate dehydrogenase, hydrophobic membrane anchor protein [Francisella]|uniref:Succinate dehydrogenase hydrophobic membrane anchor subunit n=1 Tax=Francisella adeliensis TaxID=2007306 RepID=A0A2Z4Y1Y6_9GAMM|nr:MULTISPECIES: succinate dehydrogenase, hydrophobic membrane anchor protein [Francisella]AXA34525.1 succinate dehydrogenase, hydrophobic membrane anchor protein [Francisella adeliensis]MBK2086246.1 succinate dehydrogenase, hydrophobic membrane anchor protein [Francisella adeliensis]MBK2096463.1 succinate dehydrogenase, hydrophobic membrane anchor protein [Francisella adeliensis]QIW12771.1 succinate dehydrogenase, hydrophobic membrane anchor protein [Francisella adeliensis]QIW14649.1 succinat